jgi:D-alanyl-D-alanine carboxypeptidase
MPGSRLSGIIGRVTRLPRAPRLRRARTLRAASIGLFTALAVAACGSSTLTTAPATASPTASPTAGITPSPTPTVAPAQVSLLPVPLSKLATPAPAGATLDEKTAAALDKALETLRAAKGIPGVSAAIMFADGTVWTGAAGLAVRSTKTAVTPDTLFSVASITKTFVAALVGRLAAAGTIGLDDPLSKYVPDFPNAANISLRRLLNHTSGIRDLFASLGAKILASPKKVWTPQEVLAGIGRPYFAPGKGYKYSNTDFVLLGLVIEKATGKPVAEAIRTDLLEPLGLTHTWYQVTETPAGPLAHGYIGKASAPVDRSAGSMIPFTSEVTAAGASGAYVSTAGDLVRWATALYGGDILDLATLSAMADISFTLPYKPAWPYGLGFEETTVAGRTAWGHRGHLDGFWSSMWYLPDVGASVVVLTNAEWADPVAAASSLVSVALGPIPAASPAP